MSLLSFAAELAFAVGDPPRSPELPMSDRPIAPAQQSFGDYMDEQFILLHGPSQPPPSPFDDDTTPVSEQPDPVGDTERPPPFED